MNQKVVYFATRGFDQYAPGDLIPTAGEWPFIQGYITEGKVGVALVCTLPDELQEQLEAWEAEQEARKAPKPAPAPEPQPLIEAVTEPEPEGDEPSGAAAAQDVTYHEGLTVQQLKDKLDSKGIDYESNALKADLVALADLADEAE